MACLGDHPHCFKQIAACVRNGRHPRGIESTAVLQLVLCVEAEEIGRALSVISARYFLGRVDNVGIGKGETVRGLGAPVASIGVPEHSCRAVGEPLRAAPARYF